MPFRGLPRLAVLLLAAGEGVRLGSYPKALLKKDGQSLLRRFCSTMGRFNPAELLVLTGFHADHVEAEIHAIQQSSSLKISYVRNILAREGQASSVRLGLESLKSQYDVLLVALSDQPGVGILEIASLLDEYMQKTEYQEIILPVVDGKRGNPVLFSAKVVEDILMTPGMICRAYMDQHPELVRLMSTNLQAYVLDVDTIEDVQRERLALS